MSAGLPGRAAAIARVADRLACPVCAGGLGIDGGVVGCDAGHRFDVARQGYVTLLAGRRAFPGDDTAMVAAREAFLARGHYAPLTRAVSEVTAAALPGTVSSAGPAAPGAGGPGRGPLIVDLAGGTGHHLSGVLDALPAAGGLVLEASVPALRRAVRAHPRLAAVGADVTRRLPLRDGAADVVLSVFGPRNAAEIRRVLAPGGRFIVVTPTPRHLAELTGPLAPAGTLRVDPEKDARLAASLASFTCEAERPLEHRVALTHEDVRDQLAMGPSAHHIDPDALHAALATLPEPVEATVSVMLRAYRP